METIYLTLGQHGPASLGYPIDTEHGRLTPTDADATDLRRGYSITTITEDGHEVEVYPYAHPANPHSNRQETEPSAHDEKVASYSIYRERDGIVAYDDQTGTQVTLPHELEAETREELGTYLIRTQSSED